MDPEKRHMMSPTRLRYNRPGDRKELSNGEEGRLGVWQIVDPSNLDKWHTLAKLHACFHPLPSLQANRQLLLGLKACRVQHLTWRYKISDE